MRTTVTIDDELLSEVKLIAARTHRTIGSIMEDALRKLIAEQRESPVGSPVALPVFRYNKPGLQPGVDLLDKEQMADLAGDNEPHAVS
jgi:hypothetical protein